MWTKFILFSWANVRDYVELSIRSIHRFDDRDYDAKAHAVSRFIFSTLNFYSRLLEIGRNYNLWPIFA